MDRYDFANFDGDGPMGMTWGTIGAHLAFDGAGGGEGYRYSWAEGAARVRVCGPAASAATWDVWDAMHIDFDDAMADHYGWRFSRLMVMFPPGSRLEKGTHYNNTDGWVVAVDGVDLAEVVGSQGYCFDDQYLDELPDAHGLWVWEGRCGWTSGDEPDFHFGKGYWRRAKWEEITRLCGGELPWRS